MTRKNDVTNDAPFTIRQNRQAAAVAGVAIMIEGVLELSALGESVNSNAKGWDGMGWDVMGEKEHLEVEKWRTLEPERTTVLASDRRYVG